MGLPKIMVIGDLILDKYVWGEVNRISQEAPIQILNVRREELRLGGAANLAHNLVTLGARVNCLGVTGQDASGYVLRREMKKLKINTSGVKGVPAKITSLKIRVLAQRQQMLRIDQEDVKPLTAKVERLLLSHFKKHIKKQKLVLVSDYQKGSCTADFLRQIFQIARKNKVPVIVDPKGSDYRKYKGANGLAPNRSEVELATGLNITHKKSRRLAARKLIRDLKLDFIIITLGEKGIYFLDKKGREIYDPARSLSVFDVSGAGDTVMAALALGLAGGLDFTETIHLANLAAGVVVSKVGTATVSREEIIAHWHSTSPDGESQVVAKIKNISGLRKVVQEIRRSTNKKRVFTNGCFDLLHPGHIQSLEFARSQGDILVVGLNSDRSARRLKGSGRPVFPQHQRSRLLAALSCVDYVTVFDELTPLNLIRKIKPDRLVKGADWRGKKVVGQEIVKARGGKVVFAPLIKGVSTTNIIKNLRH